MTWLGKTIWSQKTLINVMLFSICFLWTLPTLGLLVTSFRYVDYIHQTGWWQSLNKDEKGFTLNNYKEVLTGVDEAGSARAKNFKISFYNSLTVAIPSTIIPILIAAFAAYAFAWIRFTGRKILFATILILLVVPIQIALIPILKAYGRLNLINTYIGLWLAHAGFGLPLAIYLIFNYMKQIPRSILESAFIDGASHFVCFFKLILPLSTPVLAAFAIFQFLWVWNDLLVAIVFLGVESDVAVLTVNLLDLLGERGEKWHLLCSGAFIIMVVPLIVFFSLQRYFIKGLLSGSVKE